MNKRALVTGASGFIGQHLCRLLNEQGYSVRALNRHEQAHWPDAVTLDLSSADWRINPCENIDIVFHLAGKAHALAENTQDEAEYRQINTEGTRKLLEAAQQAGVKQFVFFSSVKAVGDGDEQPMDENVTVLADTPYGRSKYEAEQLVLHGGYVPHPVVIRPCMVYGETDKGNLPRMINAIRRGVFPPLPEFHNRRAMVHVDDLVVAALLVAENPSASGQIYIVGDGQAYSTRQIYDWIREALGLSFVRWSVPLSLLEALAKIGDGLGRLIGRRFPFDSDALRKLSGSSWYSSAKIGRELGFSPRHSLRQALPDIIRYLNRL